MVAFSAVERLFLLGDDAIDMPAWEGPLLKLSLPVASRGDAEDGPLLPEPPGADVVWWAAAMLTTVQRAVRASMLCCSDRWMQSGLTQRAIRLLVVGVDECLFVSVMLRRCDSV